MGREGRRREREGGERGREGGERGREGERGTEEGSVRSSIYGVCVVHVCVCVCVCVCCTCACVCALFSRVRWEGDQSLKYQNQWKHHPCNFHVWFHMYLI